MSSPANPLKFSETALDALRALIAQSPRAFSLNAMICPAGDTRELVMDLVLREFPTVVQVDLPPQTTDIFTGVFGVAPPGPRDAILVTGFDELYGDPSKREALAPLLNASPRRWRAWYPYPIVFWLSPETAEALRRSSRDFWEWLTGVFDLRAQGTV
jgi:hypothetical protein